MDGYEYTDIEQTYINDYEGRFFVSPVSYLTGSRLGFLKLCTV